MRFYESCVHNLPVSLLEQEEIAFLLTRLFRAEQSHVPEAKLSEWLQCSGLACVQCISGTRATTIAFQGTLRTVVSEYCINIQCEMDDKTRTLQKIVDIHVKQHNAAPERVMTAM